MRLASARVSAVLAALALAACGGGDGGTSVRAPAALTVSSGDAQSGTVAAPLAQPVAVKVADAEGRGVPGMLVYWIVEGGGGTASPASSTTDSRGIAQAEWTLGRTAGPNALTANGGGYTTTLRATGTPGPVRTLEVTAASSAYVAEGGTLQFQVVAYDEFLNVTSGPAPTWSTDAPDVATVSPAGMVSGVSEGSALIGARVGAAAGSLRASVWKSPKPPILASGTPFSTGSVNVHWLDASDNETGFEVQSRAAGTEAWQTVGTTGADQVSFNHVGLSRDTRWEYRVRACRNPACSAYTPVALASTAASSVSPMSLTTTPQVSGTSVTLFGTAWGMTDFAGAFLVYAPNPDLSGGHTVGNTQVSKGATPVRATVSGLAPGTYYVQLVTYNLDSTTRGHILGFTIPAP